MMDVKEAVRMCEFDYIDLAIKHDDFWIESARIAIQKPGQIDVHICSESIITYDDFYLEDNGDEYFHKYWLSLINEGNLNLSDYFGGDNRILPECLSVICSTWLDEIVGKKVISSYTVEFIIRNDIQQDGDSKFSIRSMLDSHGIKLLYDFDNLQEGFYVVAWEDNYSYIYYGEDNSRASYNPDRENFEISDYSQSCGEYYEICLGLDDNDEQWVNYTAIWPVLEGKKSEIDFDEDKQVEDENTLEHIADFMGQKGIKEFTVWKV